MPCLAKQIALTNNPADSAVAAYSDAVTMYASQMNIPIRANLLYSAGQRNFTTQVNQILASGANIIVLSMQSSDVPYFLSACVNAGMREPQYLFLGSDTLLTPSITTVNGMINAAAGIGLQSTLLATLSQAPPSPQYTAFNDSVYSVRVCCVFVMSLLLTDSVLCFVWRIGCGAHPAAVPVLCAPAAGPVCHILV